MKKFFLSFLFIASILDCYALKGDVNVDGYNTSADVTAIYDTPLGINSTFETTSNVFVTRHAPSASRKP